MELALLAVLVVVLGIGALSWAATRARELFVMSVRAGRTEVVRGQAPPALLEGLRDVFARAAVKKATVKIVRAGDRARVEATGLDEATLQRARNVLGTFPAHKLVGKR